MTKETLPQDLWCEYSDLPSPLSYVQCMDYDGMGNQGRLPKRQDNLKDTNKKKWYIRKSSK